MREQAPDLAIEDADELPAPGHREAEQLLGCQTEPVFLLHRRDVIEPVEVGQRLQVGLVLDQLFGPAVQKTDMRVHALDDLTVELQYQTQHAVSRRVLGPEIEGEIAQGGFGHNGLASAAASTPAADAGSRSIGFQFHRADVEAPGAVRIGLETGPTATWLWTELKQLGLPVICIDARHAKAVLKMQINKSDRNDAAGIARIMQTGWFKEVRVKDHSVRALLTSRALLVKIKRDLENQIRGLLKNLGLVIGRAKFNVFAVRAEELIEDRPELMAAVRPLLEARKAIEQQVANFDRKVLEPARHDAQVRRFMTAPGVGPITALCFKATIDDPTRFKRSRSVGAYVGLTTRRHASGEVDWSGRISKCGDAMLRTYLFEAANVLLTRVPKWSALKAWGMRLAKRNGLRKAKVAVARKLAVILHRMWVDGTEFNWSTKKAAA
jgi:transposase